MWYKQRKPSTEAGKDTKTWDFALEINGEPVGRNKWTKGVKLGWVAPPLVSSAGLMLANAANRMGGGDCS